MNLIALPAIEEEPLKLPGTPDDSTRDDSARILLVEDDIAAAYALRRTLAASPHSRGFELEHVNRLAKARQRLAASTYDAILLNLDLPDSFGLATFHQLYHEARLPVIVLSELDDQGVAVNAVREGAQYYLLKGQLTPELLARSVRYAIERHQTQEMLRNMSLEDDLTGLHNRRGFMTLAEQQRKLAVRKRHNLLLVFADLDGLKQINDTLGHAAGNQAIVETANALRETFRESDVVARLGGDEFLVLLVETDSTSFKGLASRLRQKLALLNARPHPQYELSLSLGVAEFDPDSDMTLEQLIDLADMAMYAERRRKGN